MQSRSDPAAAPSLLATAGLWCLGAQRKCNPKIPSQLSIVCVCVCVCFIPDCVLPCSFALVVDAWHSYILDSRFHTSSHHCETDTHQTRTATTNQCLERGRQTSKRIPVDRCLGTTASTVLGLAKRGGSLTAQTSPSRWRLTLQSCTRRGLTSSFLTTQVS
jgi:hypothetical protein